MYLIYFLCPDNFSKAPILYGKPNLFPECKIVLLFHDYYYHDSITRSMINFPKLRKATIHTGHVLTGNAMSEICEKSRKLHNQSHPDTLNSLRTGTHLVYLLRI